MGPCFNTATSSGSPSVVPCQAVENLPRLCSLSAFSSPGRDFRQGSLSRDWGFWTRINPSMSLWISRNWMKKMWLDGCICFFFFPGEAVHRFNQIRRKVGDFQWCQKPWRWTWDFHVGNLFQHQVLGQVLLPLEELLCFSSCNQFSIHDTWKHF